MPNYLVTFAVTTYPRIVVEDAPNIDEAIEFAKSLIPPTGEVVDEDAQPLRKAMPRVETARYSKDP